MTKTILLVGGTGFIGKHLITHLTVLGYSLHVLSRSERSSDNQLVRYYTWNMETGYIDAQAFDRVSTIINMTGANIGEKRWTAKRKSEIIESRVKSLNVLYHYIEKYKLPIDTLISSSAVGFYGAITREDIFTEESPSGTDFLATTCRQWENAAERFADLGVKTIILRKGVVIGPDGGMYHKLAPLAKLGINTTLGSGKQYLPWIDVRDLVQIYSFLLVQNPPSGVFNATASAHITLNDFSKALLRAVGKRSILPNVPAFLIKLLLGEMSIMLLEGSRVSNEKIKSAGFQFSYDTLEKSLESPAHQKNRS
ncbi:TIGR01777 family protein [Sphingobacterium psychroaquaticum]|uniref:TIGR01777 family oxidoreductase n=1 Tax=Sphingobacterium psychroaquaticum TaxID=561061 RepID=UPI00106DA6C9|nr:TIGR01777 family oxidoreductase [Sphingobacterium psychroaquaticum]QBQ41661.1 TIGR01777 family protein [Sphingobacterium psychroaquaticum]